MSRINRASDTMGIKGSIPIKRETLRPNKNYTVEEQVLLLYLLSLPPKWNLIQDWVIRMYDDVMGRDRVKKAWTKLKLKGHLIKQRGTNFTDVYWIVYEIPPKDWNSVNDKSVDLESDYNNTNSKDTYNKETNITGTSILGKSKLEQNPIENINKIEKFRDECAVSLMQATRLGVDILHYDREFKLQKLKNVIGLEEFEKIKPVLTDWIWAKDLIYKNSSTNRRGQ